jgi:hypothetical protein
MATTPQSNSPKSGTTPGYKSPITTKSAAKAGVPRGNQTFLFDKRNYMWFGIGLACILLGFVLLSGGKSPDPHKFNYDDVYSFRRITLAPIVMMIGFAIEVYAIMLKRRDVETVETVER